MTTPVTNTGENVQALIGGIRAQLQALEEEGQRVRNELTRFEIGDDYLPLALRGREPVLVDLRGRVTALSDRLDALYKACTPAIQRHENPPPPPPPPPLDDDSSDDDCCVS